MSEFDVFTIVLSFILGLGVAQLLSSVVFAVHSRREMVLRWAPMLWALAIFLFHVNFLFSSLWFYSTERSFVWYMQEIIAAVLLFLSGGLILPSESRPLSADLDEFFARDGRLALIPLGIFLAMAVPYNLQGGLPLIELNNVILVLLLAFAVAAFLSRGRLRLGATCAFAALTVYAFLFVRARPGLLQHAPLCDFAGAREAPGPVSPACRSAPYTRRKCRARAKTLRSLPLRGPNPTLGSLFYAEHPHGAPATWRASFRSPLP